MLKRAYVEITNVCNLHCAFCPGTRRPARFMAPEEFRTAARRLRPHVSYLYLHVMGEPLLHPQLGELLELAAAERFQVPDHQRCAAPGAVAAAAGRASPV